jgi:hypothetical protein
MPKLPRHTPFNHWLLKDPTACACIVLMLAGCVITALLRSHA